MPTQRRCAMLGAALAPPIGHHAHPDCKHHAYPGCKHHADSGEPGPERRDIDDEEEPSCNSVCL